MTRDQAAEDIRSRMEEYLSRRGIDTRKAFTCLNPGHPDRHPSMSINPKDRRVHCFSCGVNYDVFDLIGIDYGLQGFNEQFKKGCELFGISVDGQKERRTESYQQQRAKTEKPAPSSEEQQDYTEYFKACAARLDQTDYWQRRGISRDVAERFSLGFDPAWKHPKERENPKIPATPRLIIPTGKGDYLARDTREAIPESGQSYKKMKVGTVRLFNTEALQTAQKPLFVVEGEIDALAVMSAGGEAVGLGSTGKYKDLLDMVEKQRPTQPLIIALDGDEAGGKWGKALCDGLAALGVSYFVPEDLYGGRKDAGEAIQADPAAFAEAIRTAEQDAAAPEREKAEAAKEAYLSSVQVSRYLQGFVDGIEASIDTPSIPTGFSKLDAQFDGGLYEGLYVIGAISSLGKTTLVLQICDQIAAAGHDVLIFSLEMARTELMAKSISRHTIQAVLSEENKQRREPERYLPAHAKTARGITDGKRYQNYYPLEQRLIRSSIMAYKKYAGRLFVVEGVGDVGVDSVRRAVEAHIHFTGNKPVVLVDYMQILAPYSERATDKQNADHAILELKRISRDHKIPVLAVSSFNRTNYSQPVAMEAFKESGAIEYTSDVLLGLQLKGAGEKGFDVTAAKSKDPREVELVILKQRNGKTGGKVEFKYYPMFNYYAEV